MKRRSRKYQGGGSTISPRRFEGGLLPNQPNMGLISKIIEAAVQNALEQMGNDGKVGPISSNRFEGGRLPDKVGPISSRRFEGGLLPPGVTVEDMKNKRYGGSAKSTYRHGGSMCRGLPGGPNEFPR